MQTRRVEIPMELVLAAGLDADNLSAKTVRLLALELYREDKVSLGRASELCQMPVEQFMEFAAGTRFRFIMAPKNWKRIAERYNGSACDCRFQFLTPDCPRPYRSAEPSRLTLQTDSDPCRSSA